MVCKFCTSENFIKKGFVRGLQRYHCKDCGKLFTDTPPRGKPESMKSMAMMLYGQGSMTQEAIGRQFGVSGVTILKWIRKFGAKLASPEELAVKEIEAEKEKEKENVAAENVKKKIR
jgi:transposase-like protein